MKRLAVALGLVALVAGCDGCSDETKKAPPQPTAIPAVPAPAGLLLVARASRPVATWTRLRSLTRGSALFLPRSVPWGSWISPLILSAPSRETARRMFAPS